MTPRPIALFIGGGLLVAALIADLIPDAATGVIWLGAIFIAVLLADLIAALFAKLPGVERNMDSNLSVQAWHKVNLILTYTGRRQLKLRVYDIGEQTLKTKNLPQFLKLKPDQTATVQYQIKPTVRGNCELTKLDCLIQSPLSLWDIRKSIPCLTQLRIQPNYQSVMEFALLGDEQRVTQLGMRQQRRRGEGTEFHQLREYQSGDPMRKIDWKASSRIGKLISKEFQDEQDQQLVFLVDSGRRMRHQDEHTNHMDQALNSMLLLSHVAVQQGDAVGFMAFGNSQHWCPPQKNKAIVKYLLDHCYDIHAGLVMSDYLLTAQRLLELQRRRALVIILTNTRDEDREDLEKAIVILRKRHLVVVADLHESFIQQTLNDHPENFEQSLAYLATDDYMVQRQKMHQSLQSLGALCLDCTAEELPAALVNSYNQIKHSGRL